MSALERRAGAERGLVLISSLLLLLIITIIAVSMFRSFGIEERIAGNVREKQRANHAAEVALQYAEWWLTDGSNSLQPAISCATLLDANLGEGQICANTLASAGIAPASVPWTISGAQVGVSYIPLQSDSTLEMNIQPTSPAPNTYAQAPSFYIAYLGTCADGLGSCYQIDAVGYGGTASAVSVVQSTYEISSGVINRGGL
jgi:type IV pilus assembly protein PilX